MRATALLAALLIASTAVADEPTAREIATNAAAMLDDDLNLAIMFARNAVKAGPTEPLALTTLAEAYRRRRWLDDALLQAEKVLALAPKDAGALVVRAHVALDQKRPAEALEYAGKVERSGLDAKLAARLDKLVADAKAAPAGAVTRPVTVYTAPWCGYCKRLVAWLGERRIPFTQKDIEADPKNDRELTERCRTYGIRRGGIPITDVDGELVVGFDREKLERLLR